MADIAAGTSHNIGNILNSVKTSAQLIGKTMTESAATSFCKANELLRENIDHHSVAIEKASANYPGFPFKSPNGFIFWSISGTTPRKSC
ncbi:MAG: hypothetical protein GY866_06685 [Proteobacteria bacterium]|nr:hypothetical protein [Pseudomonadota bacterium]